MSQKPDGSLSLTDLPPADLTNTVHFPRLLPLCSVKTDNQVTSDGQNNEWVQITAGNAQGQPESELRLCREIAAQLLQRLSGWRG